MKKKKKKKSEKGFEILFSGNNGKESCVACATTNCWFENNTRSRAYDAEVINTSEEAYDEFLAVRSPRYLQNKQEACKMNGHDSHGRERVAAQKLDADCLENSCRMNSLVPPSCLYSR
jgi:hypothetical protein